MRIFRVVLILSTVFVISSAQWVQMNAPSSSGITYSSFVSTEGAFLVGSNGLGIHQSIDEGLNWTKIANATIENSTHIMTAIDTNIYLGMNTTGVAFSSDNGATWTNISNGITNKKIMTIAKMGRYLFAAGTSFYRSSDLGATWTESGAGLPTSDKKDIIIMDNKVFICAKGSGVYLSTDSGATFTSHNGNLPHTYTKRLLQKGEKVFLWLGNAPYVSTDSCATWTTASTGSVDAEPLCVYTDGNIIFNGTFGSGIYYTNNDGGQWLSDNTGLTNLNVRGIIVRGGYVFVGTDGAIWRRPLCEFTTAISKDRRTSTGNFSLFPAYPNPFNPSVTIPYSLAEDGQMSLKVFNLRGELVEVLISNYTLKGTYSVTWQPQNISAGIYLVRLESGNKTNLQKVVFVK
ncbi:MAG TPA: T9SS type A sorting domain-containing protein [Candidatus Marinimicrobia bacterium]|jgi:photosystem II stability/assembly factor-like uncharacterized protein|nr:T9SS type A sorting domain-containing protein [Candidatus Neomarinimicrobiota bacterium]HQO74957.1 T9SS type A sorting domain-containing protein [Candidatus Neomarinimicrobiota bacterium]HQQ86122.1 T9SS type A sorting domain-containing protein [Candidatus Neomarinimicrobiota bacterium]